MRLKLALQSGTEVDDISVTVDATATVGELAERLRVSHPRVRSSATPDQNLCIRVDPGGFGERTIAPGVTVGEAGIRSGDVVAITNASLGSGRVAKAAATVNITSGPDAGKSFSLALGTAFVGRDRSCEIQLSDPLTSKRHARITVTDMVEVVDDNSANGVIVNGELVQRAIIRSGDTVTFGDTECSITLHSVAASSATSGGGSSIEFNRSPRLDPRYEGVELVAPEPPERPRPQRFPWISIVAPVLMGAVMYAVTQNILSIMFIALSPIMMVGSFYEGKRSANKALKEGSAQFRASLKDLAVQLQYALEREQIRRRIEHPAVVEVVEAMQQLTPLAWTRRPEHESFAQIRLGLGLRPSRNTVKLPDTNSTIPELWRELHEVVGQFAYVDRVPVVADLRECGNIGVAGPSAFSHPLAASIVAQFVGLHSPAEVILAAITTQVSVARWEWLKWLPHAGSDHSPMPGEHLASTGTQVASLVAELEDLVQERAAQDGDDKRPIPLVLVLVEDDAAQDRARLVQLAERGPAQGVHLIWISASLERIPAACRTFLHADPNDGGGLAGYVTTGEGVEPVELEPLSSEESLQASRALSPVVDAGALLVDQSDLPRTVSFLALAGVGLAEDPDEVVEHWRGNKSLPDPDGLKLKRDNTLRALVGQSAVDPCYLDLRTNGPHALVGGTTGAGKSEFLQSWILGMASAHSPARVNFLFVDYKGGAAFAECLDLPHSVGLVTDLSPHLVRRALRSLNAELRRREHLLNAKKAKDLLELERRRDPEAPPSLVIVVDEFAALISEVPEFVDGVVNVAQRGRSLGLHLILATQRPAGVIKGNLRANTNLRVALRMADSEDSTDVVDNPIAGTFDPAIPGRAVAKMGPGRLTNFQAAYVGGHTSDSPPPALIDVNDFGFSVGHPWDVPESVTTAEPEVTGPADIRRIVDTIVAANGAVGLSEPQKPWLPDLAATYRLEDLPSDRTDEELVYGVIDKPDDQAQPVVSFRPDLVGNMAIYGTGGSGKSAFLRTIAVAAGFAPARGGACHVYGLDFGARGLDMLSVLPHVGAIINADDSERTLRLLKMLRQTIDERAERYAAAKAATIVEYRSAVGNPSEPRLILLLDNFGAFRSMYELGAGGSPYELLESIAADGRSVGVHLVATADQTNAFPTGLRSVLQSQVALRLTSELELATLDIPSDVFDESSPPGRGFTDDSDFQVAVLGGDAVVAKQSAAMAELAEAMTRAGVAEAPPIAQLADEIPATAVVQRPGDTPILGVWDETLEPIGFPATGIFVVAGPPQSGKTSTVVSMLASIETVNPGVPMALIGPRRSALVSTRDWQVFHSDAEAISSYASELTEKIAAQDPEVEGLVLVIEGVGELANSVADEPLQALLRACRANSKFVIVEGETTEFNGAWGLMAAVKLDRTGIALQPNQADGDYVFSADFPRVSRVEFPVGRGFYVRAGRHYRVQVLLPPGEEGSAPHIQDS